MRNIYVASSWRNRYQPRVVEELRMDGHAVYDFRNPAPGNNGFAWRDIHPDFDNWTKFQYREALQHPLSEEGFRYDMEALKACDTCVLLLPCGRSAHLEAGIAIGAGKRVHILLTDERDVAGHSLSDTHPCTACGDMEGCHLASKPSVTPELMYKAADCICLDLPELRKVLWC